MKKDKTENGSIISMTFLRKNSVIGNLNEIVPVLSRLGILDDPPAFSLKKYEAAKKRLIKGKSMKSDGISTEVLQRCNLDEIMLSFVDRQLGGEKLDQWLESDPQPLLKFANLSKTDIQRNSFIFNISKTHRQNDTQQDPCKNLIFAQIRMASELVDSL